jgi:DNA-binding NarL/FixJ family response regulator
VNRPRVLLADDHRLVGEGLKRLLDDHFELVGIVEDGRALVAAAKKLQQTSLSPTFRCRTSTASTPWR